LTLVDAFLTYGAEVMAFNFELFEQDAYQKIFLSFAFRNGKSAGVTQA